MAVISVLLLGEVQLHADGRPLPLSGARQQKLLAVLALAERKLVPMAALVDNVWVDEPPRTAVRQVRNLVTELRRTMVAAGAPPTVIVAESDGFRMDLTGCRCDVADFDALAAGGESEAALALWRGPALAGLDGEPLRAAATVLTERRLDVLEQHVEALLADDGTLTVPPVLIEAAAAHPLRESLIRLAMTTLYRAGRQSDAIDIYTTLRTRLRTELGIEPGRPTRDLYEQILRQDPVLTRTASRPTPVPRQLPGMTTELVGRDKLLSQVLGFSRNPRTAFAPVGLLVGPAGMGKTSLALTAAAALAANFPDGQLFADLGGVSGPPADPHTVLGRLLAALGISSAQIPDDPDERLARYRTELAGRRILVVLDDVATEQQVRPLLPSSPSCAALITSRRRLGALVGVVRWPVPALEPDDGLTILTTTVGAERVAAEQRAANELIALCGGLPLALCIVAGRLAARPDLTIAELCTDLGRQRRCLDALRVGDLDVRAAINLSYSALEPALKRLFRSLGLISPGEWPDWVCETLADSAAGAHLDGLVDLHLVDPAGRDALGQHRYRMHRLIHDFARERALAEESPSARCDIVDRNLAGWLERAKKAADLLAKTGSRDWFDVELANLLAAIDEACGLESGRLAGELAQHLGSYLIVRSFTRDEGKRLLAAAERVRETGPDETLLRLLSVLFQWLSRTGNAEQMLMVAQEQEQLALRLGNPTAARAGLLNTVWAFLRAGRLPDAEARIAEAAEGAPDSRIAVILDIATANVHLEAGRPAEALAYAERANDRADALGEPPLLLRCAVERAMALMETGRITDSAGIATRGLALANETRNEQLAAYFAHIRAEIDALRGDWHQAAEAMAQVLRTYENNADWLGLAIALGLVADLARVRGDPEAGIESLERAGAIWRQLGAPLELARTHARAERLYSALGDQESAAHHERSWRTGLADLGLEESSLRLMIP